jgi:hypothetical protein
LQLGADLGHAAAAGARSEFLGVVRALVAHRFAAPGFASGAPNRRPSYLGSIATGRASANRAAG